MRHFPNPFINHPPNLDIYSKSDAAKRVSQLVDLIESRRTQVARESHAGLYLGPAGVAFALWRLAKVNKDANLMRSAWNWVNGHLQFIRQNNVNF